MIARVVLIVVCLTAAARAQPGVELRTLTHEGVTLDVVRIDLRRAELRLFWRSPTGARLSRLGAVRELLRARGSEPLAITNAGIFGAGAPVGLHVERGRTLHPLDRARGAGNFYLQPNGVFFVDENGAGILETGELGRHAAAHTLLLATQSGPLLVRAGALHPKFTRRSKNALLRSGIGVTSPHEVVLAISRGPITFYDFARFFRDRLECPDALYLDGTISRLWAPALGLTDDGGDFMGILAVTARPPKE